MEERLGAIYDRRTRRSKIFTFWTNVFAVIGLLAVLGISAAFGLGWIFRGMGVKTVLRSVANSDRSAKATLYQIDAGAMAATRTHVALSSTNVDGSERGNDVLTFLHLEKNDAGDISLEWKTNCSLVVTYPERAEIEFAISKIRGITIQLIPK